MKDRRRTPWIIELLEGIANNIDCFWLDIVVMFTKSKPLAIDDGSFMGTHLTVYLEANMVKIGDAFGHNIWRVKYDPVNDTIQLYKGLTCHFNDIYHHSMMDWVRLTKIAFRDHHNKKIDKILLADQ